MGDRTGDGLSDTELEEYFANCVTTDGVFDSFKLSREAKPLPCWCRGVELPPLEELPLFRYLKQQNDAISPSRNGFTGNGDRRCQGQGRGRPRADAIVAGRPSSGSSSDEEDDLDRVGQYWRRQKPLTFGASQPSSAANEYAPKTTTEVRAASRTSEQRKPVHGPRAPDPGGRSRTTVVFRRSSKPRKGSFDPREYSPSYGLGPWAEGRATASPSSSDDDRDSSTSSGDPRASPAKVAEVLRVGNLPRDVSRETLEELLSLYGGVEEIVFSDGGDDDRTAEVAMSRDVDLRRIARCLGERAVFGASTKPLTVKVVQKGARRRASSAVVPCESRVSFPVPDETPF